MMDTSKATVIWRFEDAPPELKGLSELPGREFWLATMPSEGPFYAHVAGALWKAGPWSCDKISSHVAGPGRLVVIGYFLVSGM